LLHRHGREGTTNRRARGAASRPSTADAPSDAGKLIKGKKRHILVDMQGLLLHAIVHSAGVQDRDGGIWLLATLFDQFPFLAKLFADSAFAGSIFHTALGISSNSLPSASCCGSYAILDEVPGRTLNNVAKQAFRSSGSWGKETRCRSNAMLLPRS
jgi:hypothetical protein